MSYQPGQYTPHPVYNPGQYRQAHVPQPYTYPNRQYAPAYPHSRQAYHPQPHHQQLHHTQPSYPTQQPHHVSASTSHFGHFGPRGPHAPVNVAGQGYPPQQQQPQMPLHTRPTQPAPTPVAPSKPEERPVTYLVQVFPSAHSQQPQYTIVPVPSANVDVHLPAAQGGVRSAISSMLSGELRPTDLVTTADQPPVGPEPKKRRRRRRRNRRSRKSRKAKALREAALLYGQGCLSQLFPSSSSSAGEVRMFDAWATTNEPSWSRLSQTLRMAMGFHDQASGTGMFGIPQLSLSKNASDDSVKTAQVDAGDEDVLELEGVDITKALGNLLAFVDSEESDGDEDGDDLDDYAEDDDEDDASDYE